MWWLKQNKIWYLCNKVFKYRTFGGRQMWILGLALPVNFLWIWEKDLLSLRCLVINEDNNSSFCYWAGFLFNNYDIVSLNV